jgi:hypothetical protein
VSHTHKRSFLSLVAAATLALPVLAVAPPSAEADVSIRVRGKVKVRGGARVHVHHRHRTPPPPVQLRVGGGVYWSGGVYVGGYAEPPPPPPPPAHYCDYCSPGVPAYYAPPPPMVEPAPVVTAAPLPPLPRFGVGVFAGSINVEDRSHGADRGMLGRLRLTDSLLLEAEMAKTEMASTRIDRRAGGALLYDFSPRSRWSAHLLAGLGMTRVDVQSGTWQAKQKYGELGVGLSWKLSPKLHLAGDLRAGARMRVDSAPMDLALKSVAPSQEEEEAYTRGRLSAILYFH